MLPVAPVTASGDRDGAGTGDGDFLEPALVMASSSDRGSCRPESRSAAGSEEAQAFEDLMMLGLPIARIDRLAVAKPDEGKGLLNFMAE